jgi:hypothetical protein
MKLCDKFRTIKLGKYYRKTEIYKMGEMFGIQQLCILLWNHLILNLLCRNFMAGIIIKCFWRFVKKVSYVILLNLLNFKIRDYAKYGRAVNCPPCRAATWWRLAAATSWPARRTRGSPSLVGIWRRRGSSPCAAQEFFKKMKIFFS